MYPDEALVSSPRKLKYAPTLRPKAIRGAETNRAHEDKGSNNRPWVEDTTPVDGHAEPNLVVSECEDGYHRPAIDVDWPFLKKVQVANLVHALTEKWNEDNMISTRILKPADVLVVQSTNNYHAFLPTFRLDWTEYKSLLEYFASVGLCHENYVKACVARGYSALRLKRTQDIPADPAPEAGKDPKEDTTTYPITFASGGVIKHVC